MNTFWKWISRFRFPYSLMKEYRNQGSFFALTISGGNSMRPIQSFAAYHSNEHAYLLICNLLSYQGDFRYCCSMSAKDFDKYMLTARQLFLTKADDILGDKLLAMRSRDCPKIKYYYYESTENLSFGRKTVLFDDEAANLMNRCMNYLKKSILSI